MEPKRPTWKSTTFILVVVTQALNVLAAIAQYIPPKDAAIIFAFLTAVFAGCNAWIKVNAPATPGPVAPPEPAAGPVEPPAAIPAPIPAPAPAEPPAPAPKAPAPPEA